MPMQQPLQAPTESKDSVILKAYQKLRDEGYSDDEIKGALEMPAIKKQDEPPKTSQAASFGRGVVQGASFNFGDEAQAGISALSGGNYQPSLDAARAQFSAAEKDNPNAYLAGEITGGVAAAALPVAKGVQLGAQSLKSAAMFGGKIGALGGAATGAGQAESNQDIVRQSTLGGLIGGAGGLAFGAALPLVAKAAPQFNRLASFLQRSPVDENIPVEKSADGVFRQVSTQGLDSANVSSNAQNVALRNQPASEQSGNFVSNYLSELDLPKPFRNLPVEERIVFRAMGDNGIQQARSRGAAADNFKLDLPISALSDSSGVSNLANIAGQFGNAGTKINMYVDKLNKETTNALVDFTKNLSPLDSAESGKRLTEAANSVYQQALKARSEGARPLYQAVVKPENIVNERAVTEFLNKNPYAGSLMKGSSEDAAYMQLASKSLQDVGLPVDGSVGDYIKSLPDGSMLKLHALRTNLADKSYSFGGAATPDQAAAKSALTNLDKLIESNYPDYAKARALYSSDSQFISKLDDSFIGVAKDLSENNAAKAGKALVNLPTEEIKQLKKMFSKVSPDVDLIKQAASSEVLRTVMEAPIDRQGRKLSTVLSGSLEKQARFKEALGEEAYGRTRAFLDAIDGLGNAQGAMGNSQTAGRLTMRDMLTSEGSANNVVQSVISGAGDPRGYVTRIADGVVNKLTQRDYMQTLRDNPQLAEKIIDILYDPQRGRQFMNDMSRLSSEKGSKSGGKASALIALTAAAQANLDQQAQQ